MHDRDSLRELIDTWYDDWFAMDRLYYEWARSKGLSLTSLFCLYVIHSRDEYCTPGEIAVKLARSRQTVNSALDHLERQGLILRKADPRDRRGRVVSFTQEGRAYAQSLLGELDTLERKAFSTLSPQEGERMVALNERLAQCFHSALIQERAGGSSC